VSPDLQQFETAGYAVFPEILSDRQLQHLAREIERFPDVTTKTRKVLEAPWCSDTAEQLRGDPRLRPLLPPDAQAVQCTLFSKTMENNWLVSLHQDVSIPVAERVESPQCSGWSHKEGDLFVQPPVSTLERIVALRLHLDDCDEGNGALRVVPGSHRLGRLSNSAAQQSYRRVLCSRPARWSDGDAPAAASCIVEGIQRLSSASATFRLRTARLALGSALASPKPVGNKCPLRVAICLWTPALSVSRGRRPNFGQLCGGKHRRLAAARGLGYANKTQILAEITS
jgi:hypothetical protein